MKTKYTGKLRIKESEFNWVDISPVDFKTDNWVCFQDLLFHSINRKMFKKFFWLIVFDEYGNEKNGKFYDWSVLKFDRKGDCVARYYVENSAMRAWG